VLNPETVSYLVDQKQMREVYLVGTAHVSKESADDVERTLRIVKPDCVMVELCADRAKRVRAEAAGEPVAEEELARRLIQDLFKRGSGPPGFWMEWILKVGLRTLYVILRQYGMVPGLEFQVALREADRLGLQVCLGDRDVNETLSRLRSVLAGLSFSDLANPPPMPRDLEEALGKMQIMDFGQSIEQIKNRRQIAMFRDYMSKSFPGIMNEMVTNRDIVMTGKLLTECKPGRTVAVVGMAHMDGIEEQWRQRGGDVYLHEHNSMRR